VTDTEARRPPSGGYEPPPAAAAAPRRAPAPPRTPGLPRLARGGTPLVWRIFAAAAALLALMLAMVLGTLTVFADRSADEALAHGLRDAGGHVAALLDGRTSALTSGVTVFAQAPELRSLLMHERPADLHDRALETAQRIGATWVQITDRDGLRLAKSDDPGAPIESLAGSALVGAALGGRTATGAGVVGDSAIIEGVAVPVTATLDSAGHGGTVVGVLVAARTLDDSAARELRRSTESEVVVYFDDGAGRLRVGASTLPAALRPPVLDALRRPVADSAAPLTLRLGGTTFVGQRTELRSATGDVVGGVLTLRSRDRELAPFVALRHRIALVGAAGLLLAFGVAYAVARQITRPILALRDAARRVAAGDWSADVAVGSTGEVGELADAVRSVLDNVHERHALAGVVERARAVPSAGLAAVAALPDATLSPGTAFARRYTIEAVLGVGGNGVVYRAADRELGETVAIKTLRPEALGGPEAIERLKDEIRLARRISHPGVVRIHDLGESDGAYFVTMEHVAGLSVAEVLRRLGRLPAPQVVALGKQLCAALGAAHAQGVIHRDVKPQNLMLQPDGALKVLDFGVARLAERASGITTAGLVVGTPEYMAPEQLLDEPVDARADVYAAGVVLYEALTGRRPYEAGTPAALIARVLTEAPPAPNVLEPAVPAALSEVVVRAMARERDERPNAAELYERLTALR